MIGSLALAGIPPFAGFFSKDAIIEAVQLSTRARARLRRVRGDSIGVFITALYTFRMLFMAASTAKSASGTPPAHDDAWQSTARQRRTPRSDPRESPWVVTVPLVAAGDSVRSTRAGRTSTACCSAISSAARS